MKRLNLSKEQMFLMISMFAYSIVISMTSILTQSLFKANDISSSLVGYMDNVKILVGMVILCSLPSITKKIGIVLSAIMILFFYGLPLLFFKTVSSTFGFFVCMGSYGVGIVAFRAVLESVINMITTDAQRSRIISLLALSYIAGISCGSLLVDIFGIESYLSFILDFSFVLISAGFFWKFRNYKLKIEKKARLNLMRHFAVLPMVNVSYFIMNFLRQALFVFGIFYALSNGYTTAQSALFITFFSISGYFINYPVGFILDKTKKHYLVMISSVFVCIISWLSLKFAISNRVISYILLFILGSGISTINISCSSILNNHYKKSGMLSANSSLWVFGSVGMFLSSLLIGISMQKFGNDGFFIPILGVLILYIGILIRYRKKIR